MVISITNLAAIDACDAVVDRVDLGSTDLVGDIKVYDGTIPASADTALSGNTLLAEVEAQNPAFNAASDAAPGAVATLQGLPLSDISVDATGTASFFRMTNRDNLEVIQGNVGTSGTDMIVNSVSLVALATFTITALTVTMPES